MFQPLTLAAIAGAAALGGCSPALDWREVRLEAAPLRAMFPCKPESGARQVPLAGRDVRLQAYACQAGGHQFAVLAGDLGSPAEAGAALQQWKAASLANLHGQTARERRFVPAGALDVPQSVQVAATGARADGAKLQARLAYFARGGHVFQAAVYSDDLRDEAADPFFAGLQLQ